MSADRWSVCPNCYKAHYKTVDDAEKDLEESYGKVTLNE